MTVEDNSSIKHYWKYSYLKNVAAISFEQARWVAAQGVWARDLREYKSCGRLQVEDQTPEQHLQQQQQ